MELGDGGAGHLAFHEVVGAASQHVDVVGLTHDAGLAFQRGVPDCEEMKRQSEQSVTTKREGRRGAWAHHKEVIKCVVTICQYHTLWREILIDGVRYSMYCNV